MSKVEMTKINEKDMLFYCSMCGTHQPQSKGLCMGCWKALRDEVISRDKGCVYCGEDTYEVLLPHHLTDKQRSDYNFPENMVTACWNCHTITHHKGLTQEKKVLLYLYARSFRMEAT